MAEAEDVLTDAARHATAFAQDLWRRRRAAQAGPAPLALADVAARIDLFLSAVFGRSFPLRVAQAPAAPTWLSRWMKRGALPPQREAVPATDGESLWLPGVLPRPCADPLERFRLQALRQALRAERGSAQVLNDGWPPALRDAGLLLEARAADAELLLRLPGVAAALQALRVDSLAHRPPLPAFPAGARAFEERVRSVLQGNEPAPPPASPDEVLEQARALLAQAGVTDLRQPLLWADGWTGRLRAPAARAPLTPLARGDDEDDTGRVPRSARLPRRPEVREALEDEDEEHPGAWMVQTAQPNEAAEDPMGLQRPTDRDETTASEEFADALSELPEARLVATPGKPKEVLLSDDPPERRSRRAAEATQEGGRLHYPEWDWRTGGYSAAGCTVHLLDPQPGPMEWVERTLAGRGAMLHEIRRRFELLRAQRQRLRRQLEGDGVDLEAWIEAQADFRAGLPLSQRLYLSERRARRDLAVTLLVDVSGSTDGWIAADQRVIDVEREALLLVCIALDGMSDPFSVLAFSGEGPQAVVVRPVKGFQERYGTEVARRIAGLEPEHYTRAGAALRHATATLMREPAEHRLLLLLSDGKPSDVDDYEGRYGVEDMRQAVAEARLQGVSPFCLTIDRQAAGYLPAVFGPQHYALLPRPELLPTVLLEWLRRLVAT